MRSCYHWCQLYPRNTLIAYWYNNVERGTKIFCPSPTKPPVVITLVSSPVLAPPGVRHRPASLLRRMRNGFGGSEHHPNMVAQYGNPYLRENTTIHTFVAMLEYVSLGLIGHLGFGLAVRAWSKTYAFNKALSWNIAEMVRGTLAGNACVSATRWNRVITVSAPVLWSVPDSPHLPLAPFLSPTGERKGRVGAGTKNIGNPSRNGCMGTVRSQ